ncbi:stalk domain-containing protein [Bacillota bacterium LX-D]|nr:stalk domain-containing protein [Bacillota bacterium LX-D]
MPKVKWLAICLVLVIALGSLAGCSQAEQGYYSLLKEMNQQKVYGHSGELTLNLNQLPTELTEDPDLKLLVESLQKNTLSYEGQVDLPNKTFDYNFYLTDKNSGKKTKILGLMYQNDAFYIRIKETVEFLKTFKDPELTKELNWALGNAEYLKLSNQDLAQASDLPDQLPQNLFELSSLQQSSAEKFFDGLMTQVYQNYETNLITQDGTKKYTLKLDTAGTVKFLDSIVSYSIDNIDLIGTYLESYVSNLTSAELAALGLNPEEKQDYLDQIKSFVADVKANGADYKKDFAATLESAEFKDAANSLKGTSFTSNLEKKADDSIQSNLTAVLKFADPERDEAFGLTMESKNNVKAIQSVSVQAPKKNVLTLQNLIKRTTKTMHIYLKNGVYTFSTGGTTTANKMSCKVIDGSTYLPMRQIAETFGEEVGWDQRQNKAFIIRYGEEVPVTGKIFNGRTFVKIREFEKVDYRISWEKKTNKATIIKPSDFQL